MALSTASAISARPKDHRHMRPKDSNMPMGFARPLPAISGADPDTGWYTPTGSRPSADTTGGPSISADPSRPRDPGMTDVRSLRMSPKSYETLCELR